MKSLLRFLHFDPPWESLGHLFVSGLISGLGATFTLLIISWFAPAGSGVTSYLESETAFQVVTIAWTSLTPGIMAARTGRPYLLLIGIVFLLLGLGGGLPTIGIYLLLLLGSYYLAAPASLRSGH